MRAAGSSCRAGDRGDPAKRRKPAVRREPEPALRDRGAPIPAVRIPVVRIPAARGQAPQGQIRQVRPYRIRPVRVPAPRRRASRMRPAAAARPAPRWIACLRPNAAVTGGDGGGRTAQQPRNNRATTAHQPLISSASAANQTCIAHQPRNNRTWTAQQPRVSRLSGTAAGHRLREGVQCWHRHNSDAQGGGRRWIG